jgi:hypothetical protein
LVNKVEDLKCFIYEQNPDIVMVTESWGRDSVDDSSFQIHGYVCKRKDRADRIGGGCLLYIRDNIVCAEENDLTETENVESLWCKLCAGQETIYVGICYRRPNASDQENQDLHNLIKKVCHEKPGEKLIVGDFNYASVDWTTLHCRPDAVDFVDLTQDCFLSQLVDKPTRGDNILDLVLTTNEALVEDVHITEPIGGSDHNTVTFSMCIQPQVVNWETEYLNYKCADFKSMRSLLSNSDWAKLFEDKHIDQMWNIFYEVLQSAVNRFVPKKRRGKVRKPRWWTKKIEHLRKRKLALWKRYTTSNDYDDYVRYKQELNKATQEIRASKRKLEQRIARKIKEDPKAFHAYVRGNMKTKDVVGPLTDENGEVITDDYSTANKLNDYFSSVFTEEVTENLPEPPMMFQEDRDQMLKEIVFSQDAIKKSIKKLKTNKAPGIDSIVPLVLKECADQIALPLSLLFTQSLNEEKVPEEWKRANVTPLFKKGKRNSAANYRPVSLTSHICKLMETLIRDAIVEHLEKWKLILESQHGFRRGKSCLTNLLEFLENVTKIVDEGHPVDIIYLDFSKAFDKVPHARLSTKLQAHGITGKIRRWIEHWLADRKQRVVVRGKVSKWADVTSGVPQGSVLGPTLFLVFINDIDKEIAGSLLKFADDTKLIYKVPSPEAAFTLQEDLHRLYSWSQEWLMLFNPEKCGCMHIGRKNVHYDYFMGDHPIKTIMEEKDLGVMISSSLKSSAHCAYVVKKANRMLGTIKRNFTCRDKKFIITLYKSMIRPHLDYCSQAWRPYLQRDINLIENVQKRALKCISGFEHLRYEEQLKRARLTTLECRRLRGDLIETYKLMHEIERVDYNKFFQLRQDNRRGHVYKLMKFRSNLDIRKYFFSQRTINYWNLLTSEAVEASSVNIFKNHVDRFLASIGGLYTSLSRLPVPLPRTTEDN